MIEIVLKTKGNTIMKAIILTINPLPSNFSRKLKVCTKPATESLISYRPINTYTCQKKHLLWLADKCLG